MSIDAYQLLSFHRAVSVTRCLPVAFFSTADTMKIRAFFSLAVGVASYLSAEVGP
jgi:hypothetical protein